MMNRSILKTDPLSDIKNGGYVQGMPTEGAILKGGFNLLSDIGSWSRRPLMRSPTRIFELAALMYAYPPSTRGRYIAAGQYFEYCGFSVTWSAKDGLPTITFIDEEVDGKTMNDAIQHAMHGILEPTPKRVQ